MLVSGSIMSDIYSMWQSYTAASARSAANDMGLPPPPNAVSVGIDSARWLKLCKDAKLLDKKFRFCMRWSRLAKSVLKLSHTGKTSLDTNIHF